MITPSIADILFCTSRLKVSFSLHIFGSQEYNRKQADFRARAGLSHTAGELDENRQPSRWSRPSAGESLRGDTDSSGASRCENNTKVAKFCGGGGTERKCAMKIPRLVSAEISLTQLKILMLCSAEL